MKKTTIVIVALAGVLSLGGCKLTDHRQHDFQELLNSYVDDHGEFSVGNANDHNNYMTGPVSLSPDKVRELTIDWFNDSITVRAYDGTEVCVSETSDTILNDSLTLHYALTSDGELKVEFCKPGVKVKAKEAPAKRLLVLLPRTLRLEEVEVNGVSQSLTMDSISCEKLELNSVANFVVLNECRVGHLESNSVNTYFMEATFSQLPEDIELNTVGSSATFYVPADAGITIDMNGVVSDLSCDLPLSRKGKKHVLGNGACKVEVNSVSGTLYIKQK